jgi:hypothetical protein
LTPLGIIRGSVIVLIDRVARHGIALASGFLRLVAIAYEFLVFALTPRLFLAPAIAEAYDRMTGPECMAF